MKLFIILCLFLGILVKHGACWMGKFFFKVIQCNLILTAPSKPVLNQVMALCRTETWK